MIKIIYAGLLMSSLAVSQASVAEDLPIGAKAPSTLQPLTSSGPKKADFLREPASQDARHLADWIVDSGDNRGLPFVVIDKVEAKVFVFDKGGQLRGATPALLGLGIGDDAVPGISGKALSRIRPQERITPAGRFVAALGDDFAREKVLWVDYDAGIAMHQVITTSPKEHRAQRLATPTPRDNRISYGCINIPAKFFQSVVRPAFAHNDGIVYILPEVHATNAIFSGYYDVGAHSGP